MLPILVRQQEMNAQIQYRRGTDPKTEDERVAMSKEAFKHAFLDNLFYVQGKFPALATDTTTTWRSPTRCATACCSAGSAPRRPTPATARAPLPTCRPSS